MNKKSVFIGPVECDQYNLSKSVKRKPFSHKPKTLRKVVPSQEIIQHGYSEKKSCSAGIINHPDKQLLSKPRKTTKSDQTFNKNISKNKLKPDICKKCGDEVMDTNYKIINKHHRDGNITAGYKHDTQVSPQNSITKQMYKKPQKVSYKTVQQYYKNENFAHSSESIHAVQGRNILKPSLSTIKETAEGSLSKSSKDILHKIYPESVEEMGYYDLGKQDNIKEINEFRRKNYFECHSAKSRIKTKASTTSLGQHKCIYRFYLNERLFPLPLNTDYHNNIRCIECKLPLDESRASQSLNGTIQAKVKLNNKVQDMILMLPVKEPLIIKEKRKELQNEANSEVLYFGVIKLNSDGDSMFNSTQPTNSLALKYQKGYKEFENINNYNYGCIDSDDVIVI